MQDLELKAGDQVPPARLHQAFGAAFSDYLIGPFTLALAQWPLFLARQAVDLSLSRVAMRSGGIAAFAFVAPRPGIRMWRLATMGAPPASRGSGAAPVLLDDFTARALGAGMAGVELECFAQNERALALYRGRGFEPLHELHGYTREAGVAVPQDGTRKAEVVAMDDAYAWLDAVQQQRGDLPLQVTHVALKALPVELQAWRLGSAQVVFGAVAPDVINLHSLVDTDSAQADAQSLVASLLREFEGKRFAVPQLQRPDVGGEALLRLGFERLPLHQVMMRRAF